MKALIVDSDPYASALIKECLTACKIQVQAETSSLLYGYELARQNNPHLVFIDLRENPQQTLDVVRKLSQQNRQIFVVISGDAHDTDTLRSCMTAGAREFINRPFQREQLQVSVQLISNLIQEAGDDVGRIITIFSNKGGIGKTTIATNLALTLSKVTQKAVALVDLNLQLGDITTFLDLIPKHTIVDICRDISRVDEDYMKSSLSRYQEPKDVPGPPAQVYVLADPLQAEDAEELTAEQINTTLTVLKATFDYVIVDTNASFDSKTLTAIDLANQILLVSTLNLPSIRSTQRLISLFKRLQYDEYKVNLVLNRYAQNDEITIEDLEQTLETNVYWKIPNAYQVVMSSINRGLPIYAIENSQTIYKSFIGLSKKLSCTLTEEDFSPSQTKKPMSVFKIPSFLKH